MKIEIKSEQTVVTTETEQKPALKLNVRRVRVSTEVKGGPMPGRCIGTWIESE